MPKKPTFSDQKSSFFPKNCATTEIFYRSQNTPFTTGYCEIEPSFQKAPKDPSNGNYALEHSRYRPMNPNTYFLHSTSDSPVKKSGRSPRNIRQGSIGRSHKNEATPHDPNNCFPTDFCRLLRDTPPPVPPNLLRPQSCAPGLRKDPTSKTGICSNALIEAVQTVVNGSDACVLAFGHVAPTKSHIMTGQYDNANFIGIVPCAISWLYRIIHENRQKTGARFSIRVSAVEIFGPDENLADLLANFETHTNPIYGVSNNVCIQNDPVFGMQLQNFNELRAPSAEKAAFYLDAALANRKNGTEEGRRNSHMFFTLHVYQYQIEKNGKCGVAGGRTKLHLVDLGSGEKNTKAGRPSLTLPSLGNVLLTVLQGQKHLPFRDSKLTQLLKETIGSQACKSIAVVTSVSTDHEKHTETVNAVQIAGRLYRIKKTSGRKIKMGLAGGNSSGGESSCEDRGQKRRLTRSASDPDCTASSSEQSCDTVIFLGTHLTKNAVALLSTNSETDLATDQESSRCTMVARQPPPVKPANFRQPPMGAILENFTSSQSILYRSAPDYGVSSTNKNEAAQPSQNRSISQIPGVSPRKFVPTAWHPPFIRPGTQFSGPSKMEQWVDGPGAIKQMASEQNPPENRLQPVKKRETPHMDPLKLEFIKQWVLLQEKERIQREAIRFANSAYLGYPATTREVHPDPLGYPSVPKEVRPDPLGYPLAPREVRADPLGCPEGHGMSELILDTADVCLQVNEKEIDEEMLAKIQIAPANLDDPSPNRFLEDIAEVEEENLSDAHKSTRNSSRVSLSSEPNVEKADDPSCGYRSEGFFGLCSNGILSRPGSSFGFLAPPGSTLDDDHPLRILSKECMDTKSDSFSFSTDNLENISLPNSDQLDEELSTDEELERAMQASMTSIRSHEILEKLKKENFPRNFAYETSNSRVSDWCQGGTNSSKHMGATGPSGTQADDSKKLPSSCDSDCISIGGDGEKIFVEDTYSIPDPSTPGKYYSYNIPDPSLPGKSCEYSKPCSINYSIPDSLLPDKSHKPVLPVIPKTIHDEVINQLRAAYLQSPTKISGSSGKVLRSQSQSVARDPPGDTAPCAAIDPAKFGSNQLKRPSKLPTLPCNAIPNLTPNFDQSAAGNRPSSKVEKNYKGIRSGSFPLDFVQDACAGPLKPAPAKLANTSQLLVQTGKQMTSKIPSMQLDAKLNSKLSKDASPAGSPAKKTSILMKFLKSPTKSKKPPIVPPKLSKISTPPQAVSNTNLPLARAQAFATTNIPSTSTSRQAITSKNRNSIGYDSGHDSGIVVNAPESPENPNAGTARSPYSKLTKPRPTGHWSSSGHGSDNSSAVSSDFGTGNNGGSRKHKGFSPSSTASSKMTGLNKLPNMEKKGGCEQPPVLSRLEDGPSAECMIKGSKDERGRKEPSKMGWLENVAKTFSLKHQEATKLPSTSDPKIRDDLESDAFKIKMMKQEVAELKTRQKTLKEELRKAKERLGVAPSKWSYDLHISQFNDSLKNSDYLEALRQETKILEKRVAACKSHVMMVTVFDTGAKY